MIDIDHLDISILEQLQRDGKMSHAALGERVHLSPSQVSRRVARLEESGLFRSYSALLNPDVLGLDVEAYTLVSLEQQDSGCGDAFEKSVQDFDEILDCLSVTGEADYILRIVVPDLQAFAAFLSEKLTKLPGVKMVRSNLGLRRIKSGHALPLTYLTRPSTRKPRVRYQPGR